MPPEPLIVLVPVGATNESGPDVPLNTAIVEHSPNYHATMIPSADKSFNERIVTRPTRYNLDSFFCQCQRNRVELSPSVFPRMPNKNFASRPILMWRAA